MYVEFDAKRRLKRMLPKKHFSLHDAQAQVVEAERVARQQGWQDEALINLCEDSGALVYSEVLEFGHDYTYLSNLQLIVQHSFDTVLKDAATEEEKAALQKQIRDAIEAENAPKGDPVPAEPDEYVEPQEVVLQAAHTPVAKKKEHKPRRSWHLPRFHLPHIVLPHVPVKAIGTVLATLVVAAALIGIVVYAKTRPAPAPPTYATLIEKGKYLQAGNLYPDKRAAIENKLVKKNEVSDLKRFVAKYPTADGRFDLAFIYKQYARVVTASQKASMTNTRKAKLAVAYYQERQYDQAKLLNEQLGSQQFSKLIALGYVSDAQFDKATALNTQLKDPTISKAIEVGKKYQAAIVEYKKQASDSKRTAAERAEAKQNVATFEQQLKSFRR
ncbi:hypothetical protein [Lacticaseibacillus sharpeae]|uniref:Uncharacterized protein n=1 Tax=Lacticaseibacillus sharpeae JCM 1186 = DSM 20505 TaxID=1291052 RepID=A0A0R1ZQD9_9LACO|nr:hypothetical protein [Lacticaseibacillus sharpeae]KRM56650.1 hypothetical protein FC18_GL001783 [Lacticaseibacillus sharpeae JCM 1186 = DSM 20505]